MDGRRQLCKTSVVLTIVLCMVLVAHARTATSSRPSPPAPTHSLPSGLTLAVIGVTQEEKGLRGIDRKSLEQRRVGFGLTALLAEVLFDTGKFRLLEEKDVQQRELLENLVATYWIEPGARLSEPQLHSVAVQLGVALLAYGSIAHASVSRQSFSVGPLSRHEQKLQIRVDVCLYEASTGVILCREGRGEARQRGMGVIYEFQGDRLDFEHNAAGKATRQAVTLAIQELMTRIRFRP